MKSRRRRNLFDEPLPPKFQVDERIFVSGQIGLVPCSLSLPSPQNLATEIPLVSQHSDRVVKALSSSTAGGGWGGHAQMVLYWLTEERHISYSITAAQRLDVRLLQTKYIYLHASRLPSPMGSRPRQIIIIIIIVVAFYREMPRRRSSWL